MMDIFDERLDAKIRARLRKAEVNGTLASIAASTGISGGVPELCRILHGRNSIPVLDRGMLAIHLPA